jgi:hypothetical protein
MLLASKCRLPQGWSFDTDQPRAERAMGKEKFEHFKQVAAQHRADEGWDKASVKYPSFPGKKYSSRDSQQATSR